jgi:hypothetical protein
VVAVVVAVVVTVVVAVVVAVVVPGVMVRPVVATVGGVRRSAEGEDRGGREGCECDEWLRHVSSLGTAREPGMSRR